MKDKFNAAKEFAVRHKMAIAVTATAATSMTFCLYMNRLALEQYTDFLKENNLYEQFYTEIGSI